MTPILVIMAIMATVAYLAITANISVQGYTVPAPLAEAPPGLFVAPLGPHLSGQGPGVPPLACSAGVPGRTGLPAW